ncbi:MAG: glycoside hydrolase family 15 protein, partial [Thermoplasmata archaeon]|nr:glycoside hydrolase family 15 protein [Thermoplasmata archaeon]
DYGRGGRTSWTRDGPKRLTWRHGFDELDGTSPWPWRRVGDRAMARGVVRPGAPVFVSLDWGGRPAPADPEVLLSATVRFWREWVRHPDAPLLRATHVWRDWVERSALLLKLLSGRESGAFVAAPTTSIPEWPGGVRNWDYRYAWVRDAAFAAQSLLLLGHVGEARNYVSWIVERLSSAGPEGLRTMYRISGDAVDPEEFLDHWEGYERSRPVRIGNAAGDQLQLDIYGEVLDAVEQLAPIDPEFVRLHWPVLSRLVESAAASWTQPDAGIWESRAAPAHYVHSKVMCWVALDRGRQIADRLGLKRVALRWGRTAATIHRTVLREGYDAGLESFVAAFDRRHLDASALRIPMTGFLPYRDRHVTSTIRVIERELAEGPFVRRYRSERSLHGPEGAFLLCSFWLVECLARSGQGERAVRLFRRLLRIAGPLRLFSEEYDPTADRPLGNYPQAFTHIGVLRAALAIGAYPAGPTARGRVRR